MKKATWTALACIVVLALAVVVAWRLHGQTKTPTTVTNTATAAPKTATIVSDDGVVTLTIAPDALPGDTTASDITITKNTDPTITANNDSLFSAYTFAPDGLQFLQPVQLTIALPGAHTTIPVVSQTNGNMTMLLPNLTVDIDLAAKTTTLSTELQHFSTVFVSLHGFFEVQMTDAVDHYVSEVWPLKIDVIQKKNYSTSWHIDSDGYREATFILTDPWSVQGNLITSPKPPALTEPSRVDEFPKLTQLSGQSTFSVFENFRCINPGVSSFEYAHTLTMLYYIDDTGETFGDTTTVNLLGWPIHCLAITDTSAANDGTNSTTGVTAGPNTETTPGMIQVEVLALKGGLYPSEQFHIAEPDECGAEHWHSHEKVYTVDLDRPIPDPSPFGCGFGKVSETSAYMIEVTPADWEAFRTRK